MRIPEQRTMNDERKIPSPAEEEPGKIPEQREAYIRERIIPKRDWKDYLVKGIIVILAAVVFGVCVGVGIAFVSPALREIVKGTEDVSEVTQHTGEATPPAEKLTPKPTVAPSRTVTPKPTQAPEGTETSETEQTDPSEYMNESDVDARIEQSIRQFIPDSNDINKLNDVMKRVYASVDSYFLKINVIPDSKDGLQMEETVYGLIVQASGANISVLVDSNRINKAASMYAMLYGDRYEVVVQGTDRVTGLAYLSVNAAGADLEMLSNLKAVTLEDYEKLAKGDLLVAGGNPLGVPGSMVTGRIAAFEPYTGCQDMRMDIIYTDIISGAPEGTQVGGFLFTTNLTVAGWITDRYRNSEGYDVLTAVSASDISRVINAFNTGTDISSLGILGQDISSSLALNNNLKEGVYVTSVVMESPAFSGGIQPGDIICRIDDKKILTMDELEEVLSSTEQGAQLNIGVMRQSRNGYVEMTMKTVVGSRIKR